VFLSSQQSNIGIAAGGIRLAADPKLALNLPQNRQGLRLVIFWQVRIAAPFVDLLPGLFAMPLNQARGFSPRIQVSLPPIY
jgi:hypothetical protein